MKKLLSMASLAAAVLITVVPAQAAPVTFFANLSGAAEAPPNGSLATGSASVVFDLAAHTMLVNFSFSGLLAPLTAAHIHCCTALPLTGTIGVATPPGFPGLVVEGTSGSYSHLFDMTLAASFNGAFITANGGTVASAEKALYNGMVAGKSYLNVHSQQFPGGEIRGFLVPEPGSLPLVLMAVAGLGMVALRRRPH